MLRWFSGVRTSLAAAGILFVLLAVLATLQYRWIGEVSEAERERMRASARSAAAGVAEDFDREMTRAFRHFDPGAASDPAPWLAEHAKSWAGEARFPGLVREVFLARRVAGGPFELQRATIDSGRVETAEWPADLEAVRLRLERPLRGIGEAPPSRFSRRGGSGFGRGAEPGGRNSSEIVDEVPALIVPPVGLPGDEHVIVRLDRSALLDGFLPQLVRRHFGEAAEYDVAVVRRGQPSEVLYRSRPDLVPSALREPDMEAGLFGVRPSQAPPGSGVRPPSTPSGGRERQDGGWRDRPPPGSFGGAWRLLAWHRLGSLQEAVAATRRRNLAVSGGILGLLAAAVAVLLASAHRAQRLARQQMEFVAGITHELRTPLSAIRLAGQNLKDGLVSDPDRVRQYGGLVEREGRRLSGLVEEALGHAGIASKSEVDRAQPTDVGAVVEEAVAACRWLAEENGATVERQILPGLPSVLGDPSALRTLFENLVSNAIKYGGRGGRVLVRARGEGREVEVSVEDRGPGIPAEDLPHIFEPFYRGRGMSSGTIAGSGLGLSLVRRIAQAHGGRVEVASSTESGTTFCVRLPAASEALAAPDAAALPAGAPS